MPRALAGQGRRGVRGAGGGCLAGLAAGGPLQPGVTPAGAGGRAAGGLRVGVRLLARAAAVGGPWAQALAMQAFDQASHLRARGSGLQVGCACDGPMVWTMATMVWGRPGVGQACSAGRVRLKDVCHFFVRALVRESWGRIATDTG